MSAFAFATPMVLWALLLLPVLWWLLRATPPRPRDISFAPTRLLLSLMQREETPSKTPWWLMLIRLTLAALLILALARPVLQPEPPVSIGDGPLLVALDDTFGSAPDWPARQERAERLLDEADAAGRAVILLPTSAANAPLTAVSVGEAREALRGLSPKPFPAARGALAERIVELDVGGVAWLADGLGSDEDAAFFDALAAASSTPVRIFAPEPGAIVGVADVENSADGLVVNLEADAHPGTLPRRVRLLDQRGFVLAETPIAFEPGSRTTTGEVDLPTEMRNDAVRVTVAGARNAAAVRLLDERFRRRTVGLISGASLELDQPLLSPLHYLRAALAPSSDLREPAAQDLPSAIDELIDAGTSVIILADVGTLPPSSIDTLARYINAGGVLLRFAGRRTADGMDDLVPVPMREGARTLGGTLSWDDPQPLADFADDGPFADLAVPQDVIVQRQLLAEPSIALTERTWATLADGTPFVTGRGIGAGWVVFFHVTADTAWSNLPLSASFVELLRKVVELSSLTETGEGREGPSLPPYRVLDGQGRLVSPGPLVEPLSGEAELGPRHPPGLYGSDDAFRALNLLSDGRSLTALQTAAFAEASVLSYNVDGPTELKGWLMTVAAGLLLIDALALLFLMGAFRRRAVAALALAALLPALPTPAAAQDGDATPAPALEGEALPSSDAAQQGEARRSSDAAQSAEALRSSDAAQSAEALRSSDAAQSAEALRYALEASLRTRLAYVATGDASLDRISEAGLRGLSLALTRRTAVEPAEPMGVNLATDDLAFFPLLYWPVTGSSERPSDATIAKVDAYMKNGGTILFDTRDQAGGAMLATASPATLALRRILDGLDIPALEPVPQDHVLTKTFYLLNGFPGRWAGGPLWVEALDVDAMENRPARAGDGVSPILITANDLAGAWAVGSDGAYLFPTVPNDPYQREMALRAGINIAIYTMTGNYKADQVHIPALLERLGQ